MVAQKLKNDLSRNSVPDDFVTVSLMPSLFYQPITNFSGIINACQGNCTNEYDIAAPSIFEDNPYYSPEMAFDWTQTTPAATNYGEKWISFANKTKFIFVTHYELM